MSCWAESVYCLYSLIVIFRFDEISLLVQMVNINHRINPQRQIKNQQKVSNDVTI